MPICRSSPRSVLVFAWPTAFHIAERQSRSWIQNRFRPYIMRVSYSVHQVGSINRSAGKEALTKTNYAL